MWPSHWTHSKLTWRMKTWQNADVGKVDVSVKWANKQHSNLEISVFFYLSNYIHSFYTVFKICCQYTFLIIKKSKYNFISDFFFFFLNTSLCETTAGIVYKNTFMKQAQIWSSWHTVSHGALQQIRHDEQNSQRGFLTHLVWDTDKAMDGWVHRFGPTWIKSLRNRADWSKVICLPFV